MDVSTKKHQVENAITTAFHLTDGSESPPKTKNTNFRLPYEYLLDNNVVVLNDDKISHKDSAISSSFDKVEKAISKNDHDDHHTDGQKENATEVHPLKIDPALPPKEFTQYLIQHLEGLNLHTDSTSTEPVVDVDLWDFAGQHLYYASHPVFLSRRAIYLLVCNLSKGLKDTAQPSVRQGILDVRLENPNGETNLDDLLSWLVSVSGICPTKQEIAEKELPYLRPPVFIVGTHADKPFQDVDEIKLQIQKEICGKGYGSHVIPVFISIDNTRSSSDAGVNELRKEIMKVLKQEPYMGEEVPVRWFNFQKVVEALVAEKIFFLNLKQLQTIAQKMCFIESEDEVDVILDFYHDLGMIIKHRSTVVLKAQWLIDVFKQLITIPRYEDMNSKDRNDWECLERKGILHKTLVDRVFSKFIQQGLVKEDILDMMEQFGLIAKFVTSTDVKYFVPSQLKWPPKNLCEMDPSPSDPCSLYLDFLNGFVPHGLFYQLVLRCIRWCSENGFKRPPTLFCNGARFFIEKHFFYHLILFCKKRFIKIILKQIKPTRESPLTKEREEEIPILVRRLLEQSLRDLFRELPWLRNLKYEFRVACPYCPEEEKICHKHNQTSCAHDDCLCLLKMVPPEQLMCEESFSEEMQMVPCLEKWFSSEDEKDSSQNSSQEVVDQPGTLKTGQPSHDDLQHLSSEIYGSWKILGRQLQLTDSQLLSIDLEELAIYEKCYRMLRNWIQAEGAFANYGTLAQALQHKLVGRRDLASKYCYVRDDAAQVCQGRRKQFATVFDSPNPLRSGKPSDDVLQQLADEICDSWKKLGRQLKLTEAQLIGINHEEECIYEKCYRMLRKWTETYSSVANFETLSRALEHNLVQRKDLAFKYCYTCKDFSQVCHDVPKSTQVFEDLRQMRLDVDQINKGTDLSLDLKMAALDKGFRISDNQGSGNCLFYALSEQLKLVKKIEIPHEELRSKLVQYLKENPKMLDGTDLFNFVNGYQSWADYLTNMKQDGTWGDHVILYAAANCYETCIHVISSLSHRNDVIIRPSRHVDDRHPLMLGHIHEIHYVSLQPIQGHSRKRFQDETSVCLEVEDVQAVAESSIPSPTPMDIVSSESSPDSASVTQPPVSPSVLSKTPKKVPAVWKGFVMIQSVAKFGTSAYRVSGSCDDLLQLLPDTLHVQGRIAHEQVWDYLLQLKNSTSREVCVIRYEASSDDEKLSYVSLYSYFYSRKRCGVVSNCYTGVKDMYLVPLASHQPIPPELLPFDGPGLDEPRPHMLLGVIVRSKAVFKRPRALSQRSLSPPPKRRTSSASIETSSSEGGTVDSPASKRSVLSELHDSPPADIDDIVFQYNTTQAKIASKETKDSPAKASPASETSTPSMTSSSGAVTSPSVSTDKSSVASLEAQKQQLLDLQERARQYILAQTQRKGTASRNEEPQGVSEDKDAPDTANVELKGGESKVADDDDAPYDPEEGLELDLNPTDPTSAKPAVPVTSEESSKPSSFQMLVSTLQRLQSAAVKSVSPHLAALSTVLPMGSTAASSETSAAATANTTSQPRNTPGNGIQSVASTSSILQPVVPASRDLQSVSSPDNASQPIAYSSRDPQLSSTTDRHQTAFGSSGHLLQHSGPSDHQAVSANRHIPQPSPLSAQQPVLSWTHSAAFRCG
ncbi:hypothetical protein ACROYT_G031802 [Oculina patagonica]